MELACNRWTIGHCLIVLALIGVHGSSARRAESSPPSTPSEDTSYSSELIAPPPPTPSSPPYLADTYYQPALIGFRCEKVSEVTPNGVSVIEANSPVTITLYGESFTSNTIVAFTTEFQPDLELDPELSTHIDDQSKSSAAPQKRPAPAPQPLPTPSPSTSPTSDGFTQDFLNSSSQILDQSTTLPAISTTSISSSNISNNDEPTVQSSPIRILPPGVQSASAIRRFANRRRTRSRSYDCTDYNRVTSYKLTDENILSPNVAMLTITLPELDSAGGMYYYFCLKQPRLSGQAHNHDHSVSRNFHNLFGQPNNESAESFVWIHQGDEWWVTLKVEPPILTLTYDCILITLLLFLSAVTSGLNLGLMSLDMNELAVISSCGDQRERSYARTIAPLRKRGNYLLCSLLLGNVMVNSTLTVILEEMTSGLVAVIGSTLAIVVLGEIVPQAFCARQGLAIGARTIYLTYAFMLFTFPLSYPISCLLDWVLGEEEGNVYDRERLMEFIKITGHHTQLEADEVAIISGALKLKKIKVDEIMTRIEDVFMLPIDCKLDRDTIKRIIEKGYSRIPVYELGDRKQIVALILAKDLALLDPDDHTPIANMLIYCKHPLIFIEDNTPLDVALNEFKTGKSHMAVVRQIYDDGETDKYYEAIGVVTLEDVIEEVLQVEINDETDILSDNRRKRRRRDAQVTNLMIDELTNRSECSTTATQTPPFPPQHSNKLDCELARYESPHSKQVQTSLSSQLTSVSVCGDSKSSLLRGSSEGASWNRPPAGRLNEAAESSSVSVLLASARLSASQTSAAQSAPNEQPQQQQQQPDEEMTAGILGRATQFLSNIMR